MHFSCPDGEEHHLGFTVIPTMPSYKQDIIVANVYSMIYIFLISEYLKSLHILLFYWLFLALLFPL